MSEEILEQTAEELEEEQQAVAESSGEEILDEAKAKVEEDEDGEEEEEMEEAVSTPKTKAGMIKALYNQLNGMKKSDLSDSFSKITASLSNDENITSFSFSGFPSRSIPVRVKYFALSILFVPVLF